MRIAAAIVSCLALSPGAGQEAPRVDFIRDIQPIFRASCLKCHGPEGSPKGQLRLDARALAMKGGVNGRVIVPGRSAESLLVKLLLEADPENRMPQKAPALAKAQVDLLRAWIDQGAPWPDSAAGDASTAVHWAYVKPVRREPPAVKAAPSTALGARWVRNPVDAFILARLEAGGIVPSSEADRVTLLRRLSIDLLGLPPSVEETDAFLRDPAPDAYESLVDRLLASPHFGERWGRRWLDMARYADSDGYEKDNTRPDAWRYRDWVIDAVNRDLPFDRFTLEQLAGDLLPGAGPRELLATAFHRQTLTNSEGGVDKEQFRVEAVFDRVETTATVWLGLTVGCARCHNHKYDLISQQEYYRLFAFFNDADEANTEIPVSDEALAKYEMEKADYDARLRAAQERLASLKPAIAASLPAWERELQERLAADAREGVGAQPVEIVSTSSTSEVTFKKLDDGSILAGGAEPETVRYTIVARPPPAPVTAFRLEALADPSLPKGGPGRADNGNFVLSEFRVHVARAGEEAKGRPIALAQATADFSQDKWFIRGAIDDNPKTGWAISPHFGKDHHGQFVPKQPVTVAPGELLVFTLDHQYGERHALGRFRLLALTGRKLPFDLPAELRRILETAPDRRSAAQREKLLDFYAPHAPPTETAFEEIENLKKGEPRRPVIPVRVLEQRPRPRATHLLHRGDFLQPRQPVEPGVLTSLQPLVPRGARPDRLDLARWLVDPANPVAARVAVNHAWAALFGQGIVRTANDYGVRGERPSHPELLDWLATEFVRLGWSRKALLRLIVSSAAYRQSSRHRPELAARDAQNILLHRQNRFRVEGEIVRDLALASSGLLARKIGGPSVYPPMPADVAAISYANNFKWKDSTGEDRYRRGLYTYFKRTAPHPMLMTFDCPDSNTTCVQRRLSNTPLQALTSLNNAAFAEAAQALARRVVADAQEDDARLVLAFRRCVARAPAEAEKARLLSLLGKAREGYRAHPDEARKIDPDPEVAAWTATVRILLNLDEFLTRE